MGPKRKSGNSSVNMRFSCTLQIVLDTFASAPHLHEISSADVQIIRMLSKLELKAFQLRKQETKMLA